jgi:hypothetical protein
VVSEKVIGPYQTVIVRSDDPQALRTWLRDNGYVLPKAIEPVVDAYTAEKFDFAALRLRPGQGVRSMKPVRVVTRGADPTLPLRMVAAGVGANVGLTLYVVSEGRYTPQNFPEVAIDDSELVWDTNAQRSNYQELSLAKMATNGGRSWLVEHARIADLVYNGFSGGQLGGFGAGTPGLANAYFSTCEGKAPEPEPNISDAGTDAGDPAQRPARELCDQFDDLRAATRSLARNDVWVTRLRANLPVSALAQDLRLQAHSSQTAVSNVHQAAAAEEDDGCAVVAPRRHPVGTAFTILGAAFLLSRVLRRREKKS